MTVSRRERGDGDTKRRCRAAAEAPARGYVLPPTADVDVFMLISARD